MRIGRQICTSKIYHIMVRGNEKRAIFQDYEDRLKILDILQKKKADGEFSLFAYCLMENHVHLLLREEKMSISDSMKRINTSYAVYFNKKYGRVGHLFQGRFKSEGVDTESYLLTLIVYIHNNPVRAGLVSDAEGFKWSSYKELTVNKGTTGIVDRGKLLELVSMDPEMALEFIAKRVKEESELQLDREMRFRNEQYKMFLTANNLRMDYSELIRNKELCAQFISEFKKGSNLSGRKIAALLGINKNSVYKALKRSY